MTDTTSRPAPQQAKCLKCSGTGAIYGRYSGLANIPCFACDGTGNEPLPVPQQEQAAPVLLTQGDLERIRRNLRDRHTLEAEWAEMLLQHIAALQRDHAASAAQRDARAAALIAEVMHYTSGTPHPDTQDAARYRWLRDQYRLMSPHMDGKHHWAPKMAAILRGSSVDAAIDAALAQPDAARAEGERE